MHFSMPMPNNIMCMTFDIHFLFGFFPNLLMESYNELLFSNMA